MSYFMQKPENNLRSRVSPSCHTSCEILEQLEKTRPNPSSFEAGWPYLWLVDTPRTLRTTRTARASAGGGTREEPRPGLSRSKEPPEGSVDDSTALPQRKEN